MPFRDVQYVRIGEGVADPLDLPYCCGPIGSLGSKPSWDMMTACDTLLMVGSSFRYSEFLPKEGQARGVQIDIEFDSADVTLSAEIAR